MAGGLSVSNAGKKRSGGMTIEEIRINKKLLKEISKKKKEKMSSNHASVVS